MLGPVLDGANVRLEPLASEHLPLLARWYADPAVTRLIPFPFPMLYRDDWLARIADSQTDIMWAMLGPARGPAIGLVSLYRVDWHHRHAWIGTVIGDAALWGKGYGTEAVRLGTRFAFLELGLEKVLCELSAEHVAARRVAEGLGYREAGVLRRHRYFAGGWHDEWIMEILREDLDRLAGAPAGRPAGSPP